MISKCCPLPQSLNPMTSFPTFLTCPSVAFIDAEVFLLEAGNQTVEWVRHRDVDQRHVHVHADAFFFGVALIGRFPGAGLLTDGGEREQEAGEKKTEKPVLHAAGDLHGCSWRPSEEGGCGDRFIFYTCATPMSKQSRRQVS